MEKRPRFQRIPIEQAKAEIAKAREAKEVNMPKRAFRTVRVRYPLTGACESCQRSFMSRNEDLEEAETEIKAAFDAHKCEKLDGTENAARIAGETTK